MNKRLSKTASFLLFVQSFQQVLTLIRGAIGQAAPVRGFRPIRGLSDQGLKEPKPCRVIPSLLSSSSPIASIIASTICRQTLSLHPVFPVADAGEGDGYVVAVDGDNDGELLTDVAGEGDAHGPEEIGFTVFSGLPHLPGQACHVNAYILFHNNRI